jgi:hypothetical protein
MKEVSKYIYLIERFAVRKNSQIDCEHIKGIKSLPLICYHVNKEEKYPFIEFMLEKNENNNLDLPFIEIDSHTEDINYLIEKHIKDNITRLYLDYNQDKNIIIKGLINDSSERIYALVDLSEFIIQYTEYTKNTHYSFVLPSEIINSGITYDIHIHQNVKQLFYDLPELGILHDTISKKPLPLPDAVYSFSQLSQTQINSVLGPNKFNRESYFYLNTQFSNSIQTDISSNILSYGVNKYALFPDVFTIHIENETSLSLDKNKVNSLLNVYKQIYIQYVDNHFNDTKVDIIVREFDTIIPLSYWKFI